MLRAIVRTYTDAFSGLPRQVWALAACLFVNRLGMMVLPFLELYLTGERGFQVDSAGRLVALYGVGSILGVSVGGWLADRIGPWKVQITSLALHSVMLLCLWQARSAFTLSLAILGVSLMAEAFRPANGAAISAAVGIEKRARAFSLMSMAVNIGLSLGLPIAGLLARLDFDWLFWIDAGTALVAALVLLRFVDKSPLPSREERESAAGAPPWRDGVFVMVMGLSCITGTILFQFFGALPVFLKHDLGFDEAGVGMTLALNTAVTATFGMLVVRWVERRGEVRWLGVGSLLICVGYGLNGLTEWTGESSPALVSVVVWSVGEMLFFPLGATFASRRAPSGAVGRYMSAYHLSIASSLIFAPWLGTLLYREIGAGLLWGACALVGLALFVAYSLIHRRC